jgi:hypothetical protein
LGELPLTFVMIVRQKLPPVSSSFYTSDTTLNLGEPVMRMYDFWFVLAIPTQSSQRHRKWESMFETLFKNLDKFDTRVFRKSNNFLSIQ